MLMDEIFTTTKKNWVNAKSLYLRKLMSYLPERSLNQVLVAPRKEVVVRAKQRVRSEISSQ